MAVFVVLTDFCAAFVVPLPTVLTVFFPAERADCLTVFSVCSTVLMVLLPEARTDCLFNDSAARFSLNCLMLSFALDTFRLVSASPLRPCLSN